MGDDTEENAAGENGDDENSPLALLVVVPVVVAWVGIPTAVFSGLWLFAFAVIEAATGVTIPTVTLGLVSAVGGPATVQGYSTLLVVAAGLVSTAVWFALFGGGDAPGDHASRHRDERRFEL